MSGVSSMMTSTPVASSNARMLRPSRPMMRPFISSFGSATADTVVSAVCSAAIRWMASATIFFASRSAFAARLFLDVAHQGRGLAPRLVLDPLEHLAPGVLGGEPGDALQLDPLLLGQPVRLAFAAPETRSALGQRLLAVRRSPLARTSISSSFRSCARARSSARRSSRSHSSRRRWISRSSLRGA